MNNLSKNLSKNPRGMTLLEVTVVILVLLSLISILFIGARAWKKGSDRAGCIVNIRSAQQMVRGYQNMNALPVGTTINMFTLGNEFDLVNIGTCPGGGDYDHTATIPPVGELAMWCSLATSDRHEPENFAGW